MRRGRDVDGNLRPFEAQNTTAGWELVDESRRVRTLRAGVIVRSVDDGFDRAAVSAHANASRARDFIRVVDAWQRVRSIDLNCDIVSDNELRSWGARDGIFFTEVENDPNVTSANFLEVVVHETIHWVTFNLYAAVPGNSATFEAICDLFAICANNLVGDPPELEFLERAKWNWHIRVRPPRALNAPYRQLPRDNTPHHRSLPISCAVLHAIHECGIHIDLALDVIACATHDLFRNPSFGLFFSSVLDSIDMLIEPGAPFNDSAIEPEDHLKDFAESLKTVMDHLNITVHGNHGN